MFRALAIETGSSQKLNCNQIRPKDATYHLKAKVNFNETTHDGVEGFVNIVRKFFIHIFLRAQKCQPHCWKACLLEVRTFGHSPYISVNF